jgi:putative ABC transport system ATP-binding protein
MSMAGVEHGERFESARIIGRGVRRAPVFGQGIGLTMLLALLGTGGRVAVPILIQLTIDRGFAGGSADVGYVTRIAAVGACVVVVAASSLRLAATRLGIRAESGLFTLRVGLFDHIQRLSLADHNEERRGALVSRVTNDIETMTQFFAWGGLTLMLSGAQIAVVGAVMIAYDWRLALVAFAVSAPLVLVLRFVQARLIVAHRHSRERNAEYLADLSETISGMETLRAYDAVEQRVGVVGERVDRKVRAHVRAGVIGAFLFPSGEVFAVFTVVGVIGVGLLLGPSSGLTAGALVGFVFLTYRFLEPIAEFTEVIDLTQSAVASMRRVLAVLDAPVGPPPPAHPQPIPPGRLDIRFVDVSFGYASRLDGEDDEPVLHDISLVIPAGQHVALVGESGSGKTTMARLIARLADPVVGRIEIGGVSLRDIANEDLRSRLIVVPQEPFLFSGTIADNVRFARPGATEAEITDIFSLLGLSDWIETLEHGLGTVVGQRGGSLSAGERQLVALARAAIVDPDILILDEATSSVDSLTEVRLSRALAILASGRTTVSIAHRLSTASRADRIILLDKGRVVEDGNHGELLSAGGRYANLHAVWVHATSL